MTRQPKATEFFQVRAEDYLPMRNALQACLAIKLILANPDKRQPEALLDDIRLELAHRFPEGA